jgi:hypothetical protein
MKRKAFLTFGIVLVFAILALPSEVVYVETRRFFDEATCQIGSSVLKLYNELRSLILAAINLAPNI